MVGCTQQPPPGRRPCTSVLSVWRTLHCPSFGLARPIVVLGGHRLLLAGITVGHIEEVFYRFWCPSRQLLKQVGIPDPRPERGHDDRVAGARDGVLLLHEPPNVVPEGFVFLLCNLIKIPLNPRFRERPLEVVDELGAKISPGIY